MHVSILARSAAVTLAAAVVLAASACSAADSADVSPGASAPAAAGGADPSDPAGPVVVNPCALVTAADVKAAIGQTVSNAERYETTTDEGGTTARCALITDGKPLSGAVFDELSELASGFTGRALTNQPAANVGVIVVTGTDPYDASAGDVDKLPSGSKTVAGVGTFAVVLGVASSGGVAFAQTSPTELVVVYDLEDRKVAAAEMETLLRAAVSHR